MMNDFSAMTVLVTGGTKGIGRATVECFVKAGATVYGTYFWGDNLDEVEQHFAVYPNTPTFVRSDTKDEQAATQLIDAIAKDRDRIDIVIINAAFAPRFDESYRFRQLTDSIEHNAWPLVTYLDGIKRRLGHYPRYVVAITSEGHRDCHIPGYDYVAASKAVLEVLAKYMSAREGIIINCVSPGVVDTQAFELVFGEHAKAFIRTFPSDFVVEADAVGKVVIALCSGLMDAVRGQVIKVDNGGLFTDNFAKWIDLIDTHFVDKRHEGIS